MKIKVAYYGYIRKNGRYNMVMFDTENKTYVNWDGGYASCATVIAAAHSCDVDFLRAQLDANGYKHVGWKGETK